MKKRIISAIVSLLLILAMLPVNAFALEEGTYTNDDGIEYRVNSDGRLTYVAPLKADGYFSVPEGITSISRIFAERNDLKSIVLPSTLESIEN